MELPFGKRWKHSKVTIITREQIAIDRAKELRKQGLSFEKIASVMNTMGIRTKTGRAKWYGKTVHDIIIR